MNYFKNYPWLSIGWKIMAVGGIVNIFLALATPYFMLFDHPRATYGLMDEIFVGKTWEQINAFSPQLTDWMVLMMIGMCGMHIAFGVMTLAISITAYREGKQWAWVTLLIVNILVLLYNGSLTVIYLKNGLYGFSSGVSVGMYFFIGWITAFVFGLILPAKEVLKSSRR